MSERMQPIPFENLMRHALGEYEKRGTVFGVGKLYRAGREAALPLFGGKLETPVGPAAGPHTQLAQNIVAAYAAGGRFFELKTVQTLDGEELAKCIGRPCILAFDEGYNCEWSTELTVPQARDEYLKAWWALKLLSREFGLGSPKGFVFNMSVGYDLKGIRSEKIDSFIETMRRPGGTEIWERCRAWTLENLSLFRIVDREYVESVKPELCRSVTLSTLHGCPPQEIERIATYLIEEKRLNTFVKCNPTLLGYDFARRTLDKLGYDYISFGDFHFRDDLQYADALPMFRRLLQRAEKSGLRFGVKLSNTLPVDVRQNELPAGEMYMSGRSLFPLTAELARRLGADFGGALHISFSGGAELHNIAPLLEAGIWPVTMATNLLKPGGYNRLCQIAEETENLAVPTGGADPEKAGAVAAAALTDPWYRKPIKPVPTRKTGQKLPLLDCFEAPCRDGCPIRQDIPAYIRLLGEGKALEALRVIAARNPLPNITGEICPQRCADKCMRGFYEGAVDIRGLKREAADKAFDAFCAELRAPAGVGKRAAVVGGGPAGLSAAYFLARAGWEVTVFEKEPAPGGVVRRAIPGFRVSDGAVSRDISLCRALGVQFELGREIRSLGELQGYDATVLAVGAPKPAWLPLAYGQAVDALAFLAACKAGETMRPGGSVAVVGGGNTAVDAARAALRCPGVERVSLVYRRTRRWMPAAEEELEAALREGVEFRELLSPVGVRDGVLLCRSMALGEPDGTGRRTPVPTDKTVEIPADTVIAAVGERPDTEFYRRCSLALDEKGLSVVHPETGESSVKGVYIAGDGRRGPATVAEAIADAAKVASALTGADFEDYAPLNAAKSDRSARGKKGVFCAGACPESGRCLECKTVCEACVDVCPNRANLSVPVNGRAQILHVDGLCNECGNCAVFCPYDAAPYKEKLTLFWSEDDFRQSENPGFFQRRDGRWAVRLHGETGEYDLSRDGALPAGVAELIRALSSEYPELVRVNGAR